jgi:uridine kinase
MVGIAGGSGVGKSWLAKRLKAALGAEAVRFSLDDFYLDRSHLSPERRARLNFDHPRAVDWKAFAQAMAALGSGEAAKIPCYNFATHCRQRRVRVIEPRPVVVVDGLWLFRNPVILRSFDVRIFLDCPVAVRLARRLERDVQNRERTAQSVREQFMKTVEPMHRRFVAPQKRVADFKFDGEVRSKDLRRVLELIRRMMNPPEPVWPRKNQRN